MSYLLLLIIIVEAMMTITIIYIVVIMFRLVDTANYSCVAANSARQRTSPAALVTVYSKFNIMMMIMVIMMVKKNIPGSTLFSPAVKTR